MVRLSWPISFLLHQRHRQVARWHEQATLGCPLRQKPLYVLGQLARRDLSIQRILPGATDSAHLFARLVDELKPEVLNTGRAPVVQMSAGLLRLRPEHGVAGLLRLSVSCISLAVGLIGVNFSPPSRIAIL
jgi:hypothetical protein